jgi:hypothetical protein
MKTYNAVVKITWSNHFQARNKKEAVEVLKETYRQEFNIELTDKEIVEIEVDKPKGK